MRGTAALDEWSARRPETRLSFVQSPPGSEVATKVPAPSRLSKYPSARSCSKAFSRESGRSQARRRDFESTVFSG
ncbi:MAG: hypothetical protein ACRD21_28595, partial [Vicinamibacteria bacterium]